MGTLDDLELGRLGRLCESREESGIITAPQSYGISRIAARFHGNAYEPHRHDTYSLGVTMQGVQSFTYRGISRHAVAGDVLVLHPDELHDGGAGTKEGLTYLMLYLEPATLQQALEQCGVNSLPFVPTPIVSDPSLRSKLLSTFVDLQSEICELEASQLIYDLAEGLLRNSKLESRSQLKLNKKGVEIAREYIASNFCQPITSGDLERVSGMDRFELSRSFRAFYATSPHRYLNMRRLERAKELLENGVNMADMALAVGFSDQSHLIRQYKKTFGVTPGRWRQLSRNGAAALRGSV